MVDFTSLNTATLDTVTYFHNFAKNIETAHLGKLYTTFHDGIDTYVVEGVAKPLLEKAPEWVYENSVVDSIKNHKGLYILAAGIITLFFINYMLHAKSGVQGPDERPTPPDSNDEKDTKIKDTDGKSKPKDPTPLDYDNEGDANVERAGEKGKPKDPTPVNSDNEGGPLEEDSDNEKGIKPKDSEKKLENTENNNGNNVENVEAGEKGNPKTETLIVDEEVDINANPTTNEKEAAPLNALKGTTLGGPGNNSVEKSKNDQETRVNVGTTTGSSSKDKNQKEIEDKSCVKGPNPVGNGKKKKKKGKNGRG